jgi:hypothetical protein
MPGVAGGFQVGYVRIAKNSMAFPKVSRPLLSQAAFFCIYRVISNNNYE